MIFLSASRAALAGQRGLRRILAALVVVLTGFSFSCGNSTTVRNHDAYVTLPATGNVLLLHIDGENGEITLGAQTPQQEDFTTTGLALYPSKKFLYAVNSFAGTISTFTIANDGTLTLSGTPISVGSSPYAAVIDPSGKYLLVTNSLYNGTVSVFSIDPGSGALSEVAGSPFSANAYPTEILILPTGNFVYVTNPGAGTITAFSFSNGALTPLPLSPFYSLPGGGGGAGAMAVDSTDSFLYVANPSATNNGAPLTTGNISGFNIAPNSDPNPGALTQIPGSPFYPPSGTGPTAITFDPTGRFVYAVAPGASIWVFTIDSANGQLVSLPTSPFTLPGGGLFALFDPSGTYFYIGSASVNGIEAYAFDPSTGALTFVTDSPFSTGTSPGKMVFAE